MKDTIKISLKNKIIVLNFEDFDEEVDMDRLTKIDYSNLHAELLTVSTLMNRVGLWKADAENIYANEKLDLSIASARVATAARKVMKDVISSTGKAGKKYKTNDEVTDEVTMDQGVQILQRNLFNRKRDVEYMDSLYWAIKSKETKLNLIGEKMNLTPEEFESQIVEGKWNGILIRSHEKLIKD